MSITTISPKGLNPLEYAQTTGAFAKTQKTSLLSGLPSAQGALSNELMYQIYDSKAITPKVLAAVAAKSAAATDSSESSSSTSSGSASSNSTNSSAANSSSNKSSNSKNSGSMNDQLIAANIAAKSSEVPDKRPDYLVQGIKNVDLSA